MEKQKKNVLMIIPSLGKGGAERAITSLAMEIAKYHHVFFCVFNKEENIVFDLAGPLHELSVSGGGNSFNKLKNFYQRCKRLKQLKASLNIDVAISFLEGANYINILSRNKERIIISVRGSQLHDETIKGFLGYIRKRLFIPTIYRHADLIVGMNKGIGRELKDDFSIPPHKVKVIYNFYDVKGIRAKSEEALEPPFDKIFKEKKVIIAAGRLAPEKGYDHLLMIFKDLKDKVGNACLVIMGDGPSRMQLLQKAQDLELKTYNAWKEFNTVKAEEADVLFPGFHTNVYKFLSRATIFVITSSSEGGPNILSEAMICGVPCISVDCPSGPREKLTMCSCVATALTQPEFADFGVLMPVLNTIDNSKTRAVWVQTLDELLHDEELRKQYAVKAYKRMNEFTSEQIYSQWELLFNEPIVDER